jgi:hypothetical protein
MMSAGDIVTILQDNEPAIILKPQGEERYSYVGEAYVHGIMDGEYFHTNRDAKFFELV